MIQMAEHISREAIKQVLYGIANGLSVGETEALKTKDVKALYKIKGAKEILNAVDNDLSFIPAADVQPVKHGRWETWDYVFHGIEWKRCSVCGKTADVSYIALLEGRIEPATLSLCGCCGARMDGDTDA